MEIVLRNVTPCYFLISGTVKLYRSKAENSPPGVAFQFSWVTLIPHYVTAVLALTTSVTATHRSSTVSAAPHKWKAQTELFLERDWHPICKIANLINGMPMCKGKNHCNATYLYHLNALAS